MTDAIPTRVAIARRYVVWEWWGDGRGWTAMTLPLAWEDAIEIAALSDAETCRIHREGFTP